MPAPPDDFQGDGFTIIDKGGEVRVINDKVYVCVGKFETRHDAAHFLRAFRGGIIYEDKPTDKNRFERHEWIMMEAIIVDPKPGKKPDIRTKYPMPTDKQLFPPLPTIEERAKRYQNMLKNAKIPIEESNRMQLERTKKAVELYEIGKKWEAAAKKGNMVDK